MVIKKYQEKKRHFYPITEEDTDNIMSSQYYLHMIFMQALRVPHESISKGDTKAGILSLEIAADQAMRIASSVKKIDRDKLKEALNEFEKELVGASEAARGYKRANFILSYILSEVYDRAPKTADLML